MAAAPPFTALVGASSIQPTFWMNGQSEQPSKTRASIVVDADVKARDPASLAKISPIF